MEDNKIQIRVRYSETDQMGVVYHGNYAPYFEIGRVEWLRKKGISYKEMEQNGIALPVVSIKMDYKKPAKYDELLTVETNFSSQSTVKIAFDSIIYNQKNELLTTAYVVLVFISLKTGKPTPPPHYILDMLNKLS